MRVQQDAIRTVVYLGIVSSVDDQTDQAEIEHLGTGFFVSVPVEDLGSGKVFVYLVTARHVIEEGLAGQPMAVRANLKNGQSVIIWDKDNKNKWWFHPDDTVDLAALPWNPSTNLDYKSFPLRHILRPGKQLKQERTGTVVQQPVAVGDEVAIVGLLHYVPGMARVTPVVRTGNIALMTDERIEWKTNVWIRAHLIEVRSLGGLSGSPVFVEVPTGDKDHPVDDLLLGMVRGHFITDDSRALNLGIAIVERAECVAELINQKGLVKMRNQMEEKEKKKRHPMAEDDALQPITKRDFEDALKKIARKAEPSQSDEEKSET